MHGWPRSRGELAAAQAALGSAEPPAWQLAPDSTIGGCFVCFVRDVGWAAAAAGGETAVAAGAAGARYEAGFLALREGPLLEAAVRGLRLPPDVLLVNATGRDHPRRAGLAVHLGAVLDLPTAGVTHRPLLAEGEWPADETGADSPLMLGGEVVGRWVRTRRGRRPLAVHAGWRTDPATAVDVVRAGVGRFRTPEPLRRARTAARSGRAAAS